jgi:hypothetical protein
VSEFTIKDSGERQEFGSGMVRDTTEGKIDFLSCRLGPMFRRWNEHLTKGRAKYPDSKPGIPNWTLASGEEELLRARESAARHFEQWLAGDTDEDHAAAVYFNINVAEYVRAKSAELAERPKVALPLIYDAHETHTAIAREPEREKRLLRETFVPKSDPRAGTRGFNKAPCQ